jgi:hypothetical protein
MTENETLLHLSGLIKERRNEVVEGMARGTDKFEAYQHACGQARGFDIIQMLIADMMANHKQYEEDFQSSPTDSVVKIDSKKRGK